MPWLVALTKPNLWAVAEWNLREQGFTPYCPKIIEAKPKHKPVERPLFGPYIFVGLTERWRSVCGTRGIRRVLLGDNSPQIVPDAEIDRIKGDEDKNGYVKLELEPKFKHGDHVKTSDPRLEGRLLIYDGMTVRERCNVLFNSFGRMTRVELEEASLHLAAQFLNTGECNGL